SSATRSSIRAAMTSGVKLELSVASASRWRWRWRALRPLARRTRYRWGRGHERQEYWSAPPAPAAQRRGTQSWLLQLPASGGDARRGAGSRSVASDRPAVRATHFWRLKAYCPVGVAL